MLDEDDGAKVGVWTALGIVALLLFFLIGSLAYRQMHKSSGPAGATGQTVVVVDEELLDVPLTGELLGKVYFAIGEATVPGEATATLQQVITALPAGKRLMLSGFHDPSGDPVKNAQLAADRAKAARAALVLQGLDRSRAVLRKPAHAEQGGDPAEARRVEIRIVD